MIICWHLQDPCYSTIMCLWGEAILTTTYLTNRLPSRNLDLQSPLQFLTKAVPEFIPTNLCPRVCGCLVFVHNHSHRRGKFDPRALKCVFVRYSSTQKGYKCFHPPSKKLFVSTYVSFVEDQSYFDMADIKGETNLLDEQSREFYFSNFPVSPSPSNHPHDFLNPVPRENVHFSSHPLQVYSRRKGPDFISKHVELSNPCVDQCNPQPDSPKSPNQLQSLLLYQNLFQATLSCLHQFWITWTSQLP